MGFGGSVHGAKEAIAALTAMAARADEANLRIVRRGQAVMEKGAKEQFTGAHPKGQPTTAPAGGPPDVVSGTLRRGIRSDKPSLQTTGVRGRVYPTAVYSRMQ